LAVLQEWALDRVRWRGIMQKQSNPYNHGKRTLNGDDDDDDDDDEYIARTEQSTDRIYGAA